MAIRQILCHPASVRYRESADSQRQRVEGWLPGAGRRGKQRAAAARVQRSAWEAETRVEISCMAV